MTKRIKYLESKIPSDLDYEAKYYNNFTKYARYIGNGVYAWRDIHATNTRELFLMGVLKMEKINFKMI
jgi:hypothetical protein